MVVCVFFLRMLLLLGKVDCFEGFVRLNRKNVLCRINFDFMGEVSRDKRK